MFRSAVLLPLLGLVGCTGSVALEELDGFGVFGSSVWFHYDDADYDEIMLTNVVGACGKVQAILDAQEEYEDAEDDVDDDDFCEEMKAPAMKLARANDAWVHEGAHFLSFRVQSGGDTEPDDETYEVIALDDSFTGYITYVESSPYAAILRDWDADEEREDNCGIDVDDVELDADYFGFAEGELEIKSVTDEAGLSAVFEGELVDEDLDNAGDIEGSFSATFCEIDD